MKKNVLSAAVLTAFLFVAIALLAVPARAQVGIGGGFNFSQVGDISTSSAKASFDNSAGYHIGVFYDLGLGPLAVRPGIFYRQVGTFEVPAASGPAEDAAERFDLDLIEIPLDVRYRLLPTPLVKPYLLAGPVLTFSQAEDDLEDGIEDVYLTGDIGAGVEIAMPGIGFTLMPEFRYGLGTTRFIEDEFEIGDTTVNPQEDARLNSVVLRLNVRF